MKFAEIGALRGINIRPLGGIDPNFLVDRWIKTMMTLGTWIPWGEYCGLPIPISQRLNYWVDKKIEAEEAAAKKNR
jgi:hypothetical protein